MKVMNSINHLNILSMRELNGIPPISSTLSKTSTAILNGLSTSMIYLKY